MTMAPAEVSSDRGAQGLAVGVLVPVAVAAASYGLWRISNDLVYIGPFDRAQFGWGVVIPVWLAIPVVAAFLWSRLTLGHAQLAAISLTAVIAAVAAWLLWQSAVESGLACQFGAAFSPQQRAFQAIGLGVAIGLDPSLAGLFARRYAVRGSVGRTIAAAVIAGFALLWVVVFLGASITGMSGGCNRPQIT